VSKSQKDFGTIEGRRVLITGGSRGIGLSTAHALAERGVLLVLVAREAEALERASAALPGGGHEWRAFDVSDESAWREETSDLGALYGLVCAAAVLMPVGSIGSYSPVEFKQTIAINLVGTYLAIHHCLPALRAGDGSIVTFSGGGATGPLPRYDAYAASKAAVVRLTENVAEALRSDGMRANCVAPGFVATDIHKATFEAGPGSAGEEYFERTRHTIEEGGFPASEAAELVCMLLAGVPFTGKLVSAQWDAWRDPAFHQRLAGDQSLGTLRRIDAMQFGSVGEST
jgi:NAD(P)-dependent dehydrogenase (short-subunit alcohol dehydrogenase family)